MYCTLFVEHLNEFDDIATRQTPGIAVFVVCLFQKQPVSPTKAQIDGISHTFSCVYAVSGSSPGIRGLLEEGKPECSYFYMFPATKSIFLLNSSHWLNHYFGNLLEVLFFSMAP